MIAWWKPDEICRVCIEKGTFLFWDLPFVMFCLFQMSGLIRKMEVRKQWISTPGTHPRQRSLMPRDCFILAMGRNRVSLYFKLGALYLQVLTLSATGSAIQCFSPVPKLEYINHKRHSLTHKRILFICSLFYGVESKEKQAMENKRKLTSRTLHVRDKKPLRARELSSHCSYIRL